MGLSFEYRGFGQTRTVVNRTIGLNRTVFDDFHRPDLPNTPLSQKLDRILDRDKRESCRVESTLQNWSICSI